MKGPLRFIIPILFTLLLIATGLRLYLAGEIREKQALFERVSTQINQSRQQPTLKNDDSEKLIKKFIEDKLPLFYQELSDEDLIQIGLILSEAVHSTGNEIKSYNLVARNGHGGYHYQLETTTRNLLRLVKTLSIWPQYLRIENLTVHASSDRTTASLIVSPVILRSGEYRDEELLTIEELAAYIKNHENMRIPIRETVLVRKLFSFPRPQVEHIEEEAVQESLPPPPPEPRMQEAPSWLSYVGTSINEHKRIYYLLDNRTNRTFELLQGEDQAPYKLTQIESDKVILIIDGEERFVYK